MQLRGYQQDAIKAAYDHLATRDDHVLLVLPTGSGKSIVIAQICKDAVDRWKGRVLVLAHRKELLEQNADKIMRLAPGLDVGIYSAGLKRREYDKPVVVAGIQSVFTRGCEMGSFDLALVDEAHRIPPDGDGMYRELLKDMHAVNPALRVVGLTATPYRMGTGLLYGPGELFPDVCYEVGVRPLMVQGFLAKITSKSGSAAAVADTSGVHVRGGEFIEAELEACMSQAAIVKAAVAETIEFAEKTGRKKCLIFACGISHAEMISREFEAQGHACPAVHSKVGDDVRDDLVRAFRDGALRFLVNPMILTEGFDAPNIDMIALMRATKSPGLFYQMCGRGFRPHPGKPDCMVLDFGENALRHGPVDKIKPRKSDSSGAGTAPVKMCPDCHELVPTAVLMCPACGYAWPDKDIVKHKPKAGDEPIVSEPAPPPSWRKVDRVTYFEHRKKGANDAAPKTMRVEYALGWRDRISEWVCIEHAPGSFPWNKALSWWTQRTTLHAMPRTAREAVELAQQGVLWEPSEILVEDPKDKDGFPRILDCKLAKEEALPADFKPVADDDIPF